MPLIFVKHLFSVSLSTRIAVIVADLIVLAVTWYKAAGTVIEAYRLGIRVPVSEILLRDGLFSVFNGWSKLRANDASLRNAQARSSSCECSKHQPVYAVSF